MKIVVRSAALVVCGFVLGTLFVPAAAQQGGRDGQLAVRSDGAVYYIQNGQRHWVPTLIIDDTGLDAIPEAEPLYGGLVPAGGSTAARGSGPSGPSGPSASPGASSSSGSSGNRGSSATPTRTPTPGSSRQSSSRPTSTPVANQSSAAQSEVIELFIEPIPDVTDGSQLKVTSHTNLKRRGSCELRVIYPDGTVQDEDAKTPDSKGECEWKTTARTSSTGKGKAEVTIREGGNQSTAVEEFDIE